VKRNLFFAPELVFTFGIFTFNFKLLFIIAMATHIPGRYASFFS
jgi:hypothetical protein